MEVSLGESPKLRSRLAITWGESPEVRGKPIVKVDYARAGYLFSLPLVALLLISWCSLMSRTSSYVCLGPELFLTISVHRFGLIRSLNVHTKFDPAHQRKYTIFTGILTSLAF